MKKAIFAALLGLLLAANALVTLGCAGASANLKASNLKYPASLTEGVYDENFNLLDAESYEVIDEFSFTITKWGILWSMKTLGSDEDISNRLNQIVRAKGGNAIVDLTFTTINSPINFVTGIVADVAASVGMVTIVLPLNEQLGISKGMGALFLGGSLLMPGAVHVKVEGKVVKLRGKT